MPELNVGETIVDGVPPVESTNAELLVELAA